MLANGMVDAVTFTSASTARNFVKRLALEGGKRAALDGVVHACIGPVTAEAAQEAGLDNLLTPEENTIPALLDALASHFATV